MPFSSVYVAIVDIWLVLSNLAFLVPAKRAFEYARYTRAPLFFVINFVSGSYHTCRSYNNLCIFTLETHQKMDFFFAELTIPLSALYLIWFPLKYQWIERLLIIAFALLIYLLQISTDGGELQVQLIIVALSFGFVFAYWLLIEVPHYNMIYLQRGIALTALSVGLFGAQGRFMEGYWGIHSSWHVLGALGQDYIIRSRPPASPIASVDSRIPSDRKGWPKIVPRVL